MGKFPTKDADTTTLCRKMIIGYTTYPADFSHADVQTLQGDLTLFDDGAMAVTNAKAALKAAAQLFKTYRTRLRKNMMAQGKQSQLDTNNNPAKLAEIGWTPPSPKTPVVQPGEPRDFTAVVQNTTSVQFSWKAPAKGSGGKVRDYRIDRRESTGGTMYNDWHELVVVTGKKTLIRDQPRGVQLEYRVVAMNNGGENGSKPVAVVL